MFTNDDLSIVVANEDGFKYLQPINYEVQKRFDEESKKLLAEITKTVVAEYIKKEKITQKTPEEIEAIREAQRKAHEEKFAKQADEEVK
jgi:predicted transcriptional regulator